jgi:hypothetical protein
MANLAHPVIGIPSPTRLRAVYHLRFTPQFIKLLHEIVIGE